MSLNNGPPLMINRGFFEEKRNVYKLCQIVVGIFCAIVNSYCFPNSLFLECTDLYNSVPQIFSVVCINVFFIILTAVMVIFNLFGVTDAFYKFNFHLMEKMFTTLAFTMYAVSSILVFIAILSSPFVAAWMLSMIGALLNTFLYGIDSYGRWRYGEERYY